MKCTLDKDALSGEFTVNDGPGGTFSAQRATPAPKSGGADVVTQAGGKVDLTGNWALSVDFGTISATPSAVFKQDGDTLTGQYTSQQYGTFPLKGTLKGNQLSFTFTMTIEGNAIDALFSRNGRQGHHEGQRQLRGDRRSYVRRDQKEVDRSADRWLHIPAVHAQPGLIRSEARHADLSPFAWQQREVIVIPEHRQVLHCPSSDR